MPHTATHSLPHRDMWGRIVKVKERKLMGWITESLKIERKIITQAKSRAKIQKEGKNHNREKQIMQNPPNCHH